MRTGYDRNKSVWNKREKETAKGNTRKRKGKKKKAKERKGKWLRHLFLS